MFQRIQETRRALGRIFGGPRPRRDKRPNNRPGPGCEPLEGRSLLATNGALASVLVHSAEYYASIINQDYQSFLGRAPSAADVSAYVSQFQQGGTDEQLLTSFAASPEFYNRAGGTDASWVNAMAGQILGRPASGSESDYYVKALAAGSTNRGAISYAFATSPEHEAQVVLNDFGRYLNRAPTAAESSYWVGQLSRGKVKNEDLVTLLVGSPEFSAERFQADANFLDAAYKTIFRRPPNPPS